MTSQMMSNQTSYHDDIDHDFHVSENVDHFDPSSDRDSINGYEVNGHNNHSNGFYRDSSASYSSDINRCDSYNLDPSVHLHEESIDQNINNLSVNNTLAEVRGTHEIGMESLPFSTQQQIEEERLRGDILRYLVGNSNGTYHYSAELRAIIHDVIGIPASTTQTEFSETVTSLLDILHSDPEKRFLVSGEGDNIHIKRCFVRGDEEEISDLVEEWRALIAIFLLESKRSVGLSDIGSSVPRPIRIPTSVKLIFIMKTDPSNRFILKGDGNAAKARYNMQADSYQESVWVDKWRDDIALFLIKQQWSIPSVGLHEIGTHVVRPFFLPPRVKLLDTLQGDPQQRFVILGFGNDTRVMMRDFRVDEPEIEEFIEHWRRLIASYLMSKSAMPGVSQPLLGLSEIGANVPRPPGVPPSVKLIDVMRADPLIRFLIKGDGNALRVKINSRALDPSGPMYLTPPIHNNFPNNQFIEENLDYPRGPGGHPQNQLQRDDGFRRDGPGPGPGPNVNGGHGDMMMNQPFGMKGPNGSGGFPGQGPGPSMRGKLEQFGMHRGPNPPFPNENARMSLQQHQQQQLQQQQHMLNQHGHFGSNDSDPMQLRRPSHLQMQVQQFHQQNTRLSVPSMPGGQSALPLPPTMGQGQGQGQGHPYRDDRRDRDPRLRGPGQGPGPGQGQGAPMKRHSAPTGPGDWNLAGSMSQDRQREMIHPHFNNGPVGPGIKPETGSFNAGMYGSNFNSQRTSLESVSDRDFSVYGGLSSNNSSSFISQDGLDYNIRKDHAALKTPISRSFSGYAQPPHTDGQKASRSFSGFATENMSAPDTSTLMVPPKSGSFSQFMGFGAIGSAGMSNGQMVGNAGLDSFSSESTEDGIETFHGQGRVNNFKSEGQGQGQNPYLDQGSSSFARSSSQEVTHRDQYGDVVRSISRSSSFGSTPDSLSSYKHVTGGEDGDPHRRGGFVIRDHYGNNSTGSFQSHGSRSFDPMHNSRYGTVSLHDVTESLEEDEDRRSYMTGKEALNSDHLGTEGLGGYDCNSNNINNSQPDGSVSTVDVNVTYGGAVSIASSATALAADGGNEQSNIDSIIGFPVMGGSAHSNSDNGSIKYNKGNINIKSEDIIIRSNVSSSETDSPVDHIHFGGADGVSPTGGEGDYSRKQESSRKTLDLEVSAYEHGGKDGGHFRSMTQGEMLGDGQEDDVRTDFSRRPSSALSEKTADYLQDDFTLLTTDTNAFIPLDKWMIKVWLHIAFSGFDSDIIEGFITKLRDDGGFVTVQDLLDAQARGELNRDALNNIAGFKVGHCNRLEKSLAALGRSSSN